MSIEIRAYSNGDEASIVWRAGERIAGCRGFAVLREAVAADGSTASDTLSTFVGFASQRPLPSGAHRPSTVWPVQRFIWRDYDVEKFQRVRYQVVPMLGPADQLTQAPPDQASGWTPWLTVGTGQTPGFEAYFNRGIVATQWLARRLAVPPDEERAKLGEVIADPTSEIRRFLGGLDRVALLKLLADAKANGNVLYLALYELDDPELIPALVAVGAKANLLLANGADTPDENKEVRQQLRDTSQVKVFDRLVSSGHFAHNKFVVICDPDGTPQRVWTGSTNWTMTGLCTQANNALLIDDPVLATGYLAYWHRLEAAGSAYPPELKAADQQPLRTTVGAARITAWTTPVPHLVDLVDARGHLEAATQGVLFLMFVPGKSGTLLNDILALDERRLFVHGVINQDPGGAKAPLIKIVQRGHVLDADPEVILPAAISAPLASWKQELRSYSLAVVHSKVVVIDPFGPHPVVITGSHNLGPKASGRNDDNLVIIEDAPGLAAEYAVNILGVYDQYKWRYNMLVQAKQGAAPDQKAWTGLQDDDTWQDDFFGEQKQRELRFWFGESPALLDLTSH
ncbi:phospholipase D-like domain-containing protein [Pengzhenrongella sp.]|jgi:phosphatidylserine/phosphatidylglycerophosphate/cardiolipin synthase-like enzyme|uniref:phospholipase D-like domain-containing protein n=1 Tax=Pengzhenrongella sp. TaxID=2888820 RepID=UPI002F95EB51